MVWLRVPPVLFFCIPLFFARALHAQTAPNTYWVQFTDKNTTPYSLAQPDEFLSQRAIQRRTTQGIAYDELDLPVDPAYIALVAATGAEVLNRSKWFNAVTIRTSEEGVLAAVQALPFVSTIRSSSSGIASAPRRDKFASAPVLEFRDGEPEDYGTSFTQIAMLNGHQLHALGAQGQGMLIGILDSGFQGVDSSLAFAGVRDRNGIKLTRDLVVHDGDVFDDHWHGRSVFSCLAGALEGQLLGTAPQADYVLLRTEDVNSEYPVEEDHWISGAELADSLGCDVLNTSLGYTVFDDSTMDHTIDQLDGQTIRMSIAANIASRKGMIPVHSAGNRGDDEWYYISIPADAIDVLTVGAVGDVENYAAFSSHGPSADGRVKPDVCAMGWGTTILRADTDSVMYANGTSFASPIVAGLVACLWQLHPDRTAAEIMDAVRRSASFFNTPTDSLGHGVPDFAAAHAWLQMTASIVDKAKGTTKVWPNPFTDILHVQDDRLAPGTAYVTLFDGAGRHVRSMRVAVQPQGTLQLTGLEALPTGDLVLKVAQGDRVVQQHVLHTP